MAQVKNFRGFAKIIKKNAVKAVEGLLDETFTALEKFSPVETGKYKANWNIGSGSINETTTESTSRIVNTSAIRNAARAAVLRGTDIYISNALPYAWTLEKGKTKLGTALHFKRSNAPWALLRTTRLIKSRT